MTDTTVIEIISKAMMLTLKVAGPILAVTLAIGLLVGIIQAATSIQEQTLTFVPKLIAIGLVILISGNWMLEEVVNEAVVELFVRRADGKNVTHVKMGGRKHFLSVADVFFTEIEAVIIQQAREAVGDKKTVIVGRPAGGFEHGNFLR